MLVTCQSFGDFYFIWAGLAVFFSSDNLIKVGSKSWLLTVCVLILYTPVKSYVVKCP